MRAFLNALRAVFAAALYAVHAFFTAVLRSVLLVMAHAATRADLRVVSAALTDVYMVSKEVMIAVSRLSTAVETQEASTVALSDIPLFAFSLAFILSDDENDDDSEELTEEDDVDDVDEEELDDTELEVSEDEDDDDEDISSANAGRASDIVSAAAMPDARILFIEDREENK